VEYKDIYEILLDRGIHWIKKGNILMIYKKFPCQCGEPFGHIHFYIIEDVEKYEKAPLTIIPLLDWLDCGFWNDSGIAATTEGYREIERRFLQYRCPGAIQNF
jgi:hypothetical protein